jgi:hypothetical protein
MLYYILLKRNTVEVLLGALASLHFHQEKHGKGSSCVIFLFPE